jgi:PAS domain S-box-containing protein
MLNLNPRTYQNLIKNFHGLFFRRSEIGEWQILEVSPGCSKITNYTDEELKSLKGYLDIIFIGDKETVRKAFLEEKEEYHLEYRILTKDGHLKCVKEISNRIIEGGQVFIEGFIEETHSQQLDSQLLNEYQSLQNAINKGYSVSITDVNGVITYVNDLFCEKSKYGRTEIIGKTHKLVNSGYHPAEFFTELWATIKSGQIWKGEIKNKAKDGSFYWVETLITPIFNRENEIEYFMSLRSVISEKKKYEYLQEVVYDIARASGNININIEGLAAYMHEKINEAVNAPNLYIALHNKEKHTISFPYFFDNYIDIKIENYVERPFGDGLTEHIIAYRKPLLLHKEEEVQEFIKAWGIKTFTGPIAKSWLGVPLIAEEDVIGALAIQSYTHENAYTEEDFKFLQFVSAQIALSLKRQKEQDEIKENQKNYSEIIQNSSDLIFSVNNSGKILFANKAFIKKLGLSEGQEIGIPIEEFIHPDFKERFKLLFKQVQYGKKNKIAILELICAKGEKIICRSSLNSTYEDGKLKTTQAFLHDITTKLAAEREIKYAYRKLTFIGQINQCVLNGSGVNEIAAKAIQIFNEVIGEQATSFFLFQSDSNKLHKFCPLNGCINVNLTYSLSQNAILTDIIYKEGICIIDSSKRTVANDKLAAFNQLLNEPYDYKVCGLLPVFIELELFAVMAFGSKMQLSGDKINLLHDLFSNISVAFSKARANEKLREHEIFTETVLNNLPADLAVFDKEQRYRFVNAQGIKNEEIRNWIIGKTDFEYCEKRGLSEQIAEKRKAYFTKIQETQTPYEWVEEIEKPSGEKKFFLRRLVPYIESGQIKYVFGYGTDVTQLINTERSLLKSEKLLSEAENLAQIGSFELDLKKKETYWSDEFFRICGYQPNSIKPSIYKSIKIIHPSDRELAYRSIYKAVKNFKKFRIENKIIRPNGEERNVLVIGEVYFDEQKPVRVTGALADITEQKKYEYELLQREKLLQESNKLNKQLIETSQQFFYVIKVEGDDLFESPFAYVSPQAEDFFGLSFTEVLQKPDTWINSIHPGDITNVLEQTKKLRLKMEPVTRIYRILNRKLSTYIWIEDFICPIANEEGEIIELYGSAKNITALKEKEIERETLLNELSDRYNELMQFNYIVSHNLRAPVANLVGLSNILSLPEIDEAEKVQIFKHVSESATRMDNLIKDLSVILSSRSTINEKKEEVLLPEIIQSIEDNLEKQLLETQAVINKEISEEAKSLYTIKSYIQSIFHNLISNAIKYCSPERRPQIRIKAERVGNNYIIKVSDNGMGIDLEKHGSYLFGLYKRFNLEIEGKGLGLHMTRNQVKALGGNIQVESQPGEGTTFTINFNA